ncbi:hypothetical protein LUU34_00633300 [Aix galericulata]|nr:hypothetical protein LUU34_00633300 [Aix galericulata]
METPRPLRAQRPEHLGSRHRDPGSGRALWQPRAAASGEPGPEHLAAAPGIPAASRGTPRTEHRAPGREERRRPPEARPAAGPAGTSRTPPTTRGPGRVPLTSGGRGARCRRGGGTGSSAHGERRRRRRRRRRLRPGPRRAPTGGRCSSAGTAQQRAPPLAAAAAACPVPPPGPSEPRWEESDTARGPSAPLPLPLIGQRRALPRAAGTNTRLRPRTAPAAPGTNLGRGRAGLGQPRWGIPWLSSPGRTVRKRSGPKRFPPAAVQLPSAPGSPRPGRLHPAVEAAAPCTLPVHSLLYAPRAEPARRHGPAFGQRGKCGSRDVWFPPREGIWLPPAAAAPSGWAGTGTSSPGGRSARGEPGAPGAQAARGSPEEECGCEGKIPAAELRGLVAARDLKSPAGAGCGRKCRQGSYRQAGGGALPCPQGLCRQLITKVQHRSQPRAVFAAGQDPAWEAQVPVHLVPQQWPCSHPLEELEGARAHCTPCF